MIRKLLAVSMFYFCLTVFTESGKAQDHTFQVYEEDGLTIAENGGGPRFTSPPVSFEFLFSLEQDNTREETLLYGFSYYMVGEDDHFYVTDIGNTRIVVFDSEGKFSHSIGREGQGPGEFLSPRLLYAEMDTIAVWDQAMGIKRISFFTPAGEFLTSNSVRYAAMNTFGCWPGPSGSSIHDAGVHIFLPSGPVSVRRISTISAEDDTIGMVEVVYSSEPPTHFQSIQNVEYWWSQGILAQDGSTPEFRWYGIDGMLRRIIKIDGLVRETVTKEERKAIRDGGELLLERTSNESRRRSIQERLEYGISDLKPYWSSIKVDESGYIWARESIDNINKSIAGKTCKIISPEGEYLGDIIIPDIEGLLSITPSRGFLLAAIEDFETGAKRLDVYKIYPAVNGILYP